MRKRDLNNIEKAAQAGVALVSGRLEDGVGGS